MRILWVASRLEGRGGIGRVIAEGARALAARGHEIHVAGPLASEDRTPFGDLPLHAWPRRAGKLARLLGLVPLLRNLRPDVVHFHSATPHGEAIAAARALAPLVGRPLVVVTPHSSRAAIERRARLGLRAAHLVIAPSRWAAQRARDAGAHRVAIVPGGVAIGAAPNLDAREPVVLVLGRLDAVKGLDVLLDAFAAAAATRPAWQLWIAGDGPERRALTAHAAALALADRVRFLGFVGGAEKEQVLARAAIGVLPSRRESFGAALLEMQERGLACVASDVGGIPDLADGGAAARLVPVGEAGALATALGALIDDPAARRALARAGRRHAERFAWPAIAESYEAEYATVLEVIAPRAAPR